MTKVRKSRFLNKRVDLNRLHMPSRYDPVYFKL